MELKLFKTLWGFDGDYLKAVNEAIADGYEGIEGPPPADPATRAAFAQALQQHKLLYIAEICTGGDYVPNRRASAIEHLADLELGLGRCAGLDPLFVTSMAGCDAWPEHISVGFFQDGMALADRYGLSLCYETHRSRSLFNPWTTERIVNDVPGIKLTADFSHWCVVCERLIDSELDLIEKLAPHIHHIHARVGYAQGPQVPHPAAPEYAPALNAHQRWWELIWNAQRLAQYRMSTMTPEFGPDGYLHELPFTRTPIGELRQINRWMARTERTHYNYYTRTQHA